MLNQTQQKMPTMEDFLHQLHRYGLKATRQRILVHETMMVLGHASADQVTQEIRSAGNRITLASVYNILSQLADIHVYSRRLSANNKMYFDVNSFRHVHLYDRENNRFKDVYDDELMELITSRLKKRKFKGYTVEDIDIQLIAKPTKRNRVL